MNVRKHKKMHNNNNMYNAHHIQRPYLWLKEINTNISTS